MLSLIVGLLGIAILFWYWWRKDDKQQAKDTKVDKKVTFEENLGQIQVFFGSQTGTAAKMAQTFSEEASDHGFRGIVIDLKDITHGEFKKNQISIFFMSNTGEGEPPDNCVNFMKMLIKKRPLYDVLPAWHNMNYAVFGLGDTQYEHFNKVGIDTDRYLDRNGAKRLHRIGLGDNNCSLEDDYVEWKEKIWATLIQFRKSHPYDEETSSSTKIQSMREHVEAKYISFIEPYYANYKFFSIKSTENSDPTSEDLLDFKTKAGLKGKTSSVHNIVQKRQNKQYGSTLQMEIELQNQPEYQTAGNIALWPIADPQIVKQVAEYFNLNLDQMIDVEVLNESKKIKLNFVRPLTFRKLLEEYLDLQFRITKGLMKKLSKFPSDSPDYFLNHSSARTTEEYKRLTQKQFCYLFKLIKTFNVKMAFQDFVQLSDSVGPRLFTIASSWKAQKNVVIAASIVENGLISKHFERNPTKIKAELRPSSFKDYSKWRKVIFIGAGTGFAPFRGFLQEQEIAKNENREVPLISVYFGCKNRNSDFIYKQQIENWEKKGIITRLYLALSRETEKKVYVQHLLEENKDELEEFTRDDQCAIYVCGSLGMGADVLKVLLNHFEQGGRSQDESKQLLAKIQHEGRLIKQLW